MPPFGRHVPTPITVQLIRKLIDQDNARTAIVPSPKLQYSRTQARQAQPFGMFAKRIGSGFAPPTAESPSRGELVKEVDPRFSNSVTRGMHASVAVCRGRAPADSSLLTCFRSANSTVPE
mmetsp:Transcript_47979/g.127085  ORF Transcript_47979/g.127085 Transcript_47979/m.127085 type:complete len:120 (+) Transcript_47979:129-488(+)